MRYDISSIEATKEFARKLSDLVEWPDCLCFNGNLGAGKTTMIKFLLSFLGVSEEVTSPTFNLIVCYDGRNNKKIWHYDLYRLKYEEEIFDLAIEDALNDLVVIEWPDKAMKFLPKDRLDINIFYNDDKRWLELLPHGNWLVRLKKL